MQVYVHWKEMLTCDHGAVKRVHTAVVLVV